MAMKSNHARMISCALVVVAGAVLVSPAHSTLWHLVGTGFIAVGGIALFLEWFASLFNTGFWDEKYVVPLPEKPDVVSTTRQKITS